MDKRKGKQEASELKRRIDLLTQRLPKSYTSAMMQKFPKRYNKGNVYIIYNTIAKRRLDEKVVADLEQICL